MSRLFHVKNSRMLNKIFFAMIAVAVIACTSLTIVGKNSFSADTIVPSAITRDDLIKAKQEALQTQTQLLAQKTTIEAEITAITPSTEQASYILSIGNEKLNSKQIYIDKIAKKTQIDSDLALLDNTIKSITDTGSLVPQTTNTYDMLRKTIYAQRETQRLIKGTYRTVISGMIRRMIKDPANKPLSDLDAQIAQLLTLVKSNQTNLEKGAITQANAKTAMQKQVQIVLNSMSSITNQFPKNTELQKTFKPVMADLASTTNQLFAKAPLELTVDPTQKVADTMVGKIMEFDVPADLIVGSADGASVSYNGIKTAKAFVETPLTTIKELAWAQSKMPLSALANLAYQSANFLVPNASNNKNLTYIDRYKASSNIYSYLNQINGLPDLAGLSSDALNNFIVNQSSTMANIMWAHTQLNNPTGVKVSAQALLDAQQVLKNNKTILGQALKDAQENIVNQTYYNTVHNILGINDAKGNFDAAASKPAMDLYHSFANANKISDKGMTNMMTYFNNDPARITTYLNSGSKNLFANDGTEINIDWEARQVDIKGTKISLREFLDGIVGTEYMWPGSKTDYLATLGAKKPTIVLTTGGTTTQIDPNAVVAATQPGAQDAERVVTIGGKVITPDMSDSAISSIWKNYVIQNAVASGYEVNDKLLNLQDVGKYNIETLMKLSSDKAAFKQYIDKFGFPKFQSNTTGLVINPKTGKAEYRSTIKRRTSDGRVFIDGYISFDPETRTLDAQISKIWGNRQVKLVSDPRTGDVYVELASTTKDSLLKLGSVASLASITVAQDGAIGGSFKLFNRLFNYNANSKAFEIPMKIGRNGTLFADTNGNVRGTVSLTKTNAANTAMLYFDRTGNIGLNVDIKGALDKTTGSRTSLASITLNKNGTIAGTIDVGKLAKTGLSVMVGFDKKGITGVNIPLTRIAGQAFGLGISRNGSLSFGGFIPIMGLPVPITAAQDAHGNVRIMWPGGSIKVWGNENRPLDPPQPTINPETKGLDASVIYFRHSFKKGPTKTVRVYQSPGDKIDQAEQIARGDLIFKVYNELLKRNPGITEFMNWYFYTDHELVKFPDHQQSSNFRLSETERLLRQSITSGPGKQVQDQFRFPNTAEYRWIQSGKDPLASPNRPADLLDSNPFKPSIIDNAQNACEAAADSTTVCDENLDSSGNPIADSTDTTTVDTSDSTNIGTALEDFYGDVEAAAIEDPLFPESEKIRL